MSRKVLISAAAFYFSLTVLGANAWAAEAGQVVTPSANQVKASSAEVKADAGPSKSQDLDTEVKDIKLRADSGKKSKFSSSFYLTYSGASLHKPNDDVRPNVGGDRRVSPVTLSGNVGVRYRKNKNESFFLATGITRVRPFHSRETGDPDWDLSTPHFAYNKTHALNKVQISSSYRAYVMTEDFNRDIGQVTTLGYSLIAKNAIGQSKFSGGISMNLYYTAYDKSSQDDFQMGPRSVKMGTFQNDYGVGISPQVQYSFNDRSYAYTSWSLWNYSHYRLETADGSKWDHGNITQSLGAGFAVARDFFVGPYITFEPDDISRDETTVNLTTTINL